MTHPNQPNSKSEPLEELLTLDEVVAWLRVPRSWVYERTRKGQIPCFKLGKYLRFPRLALAQWLAARSGLEATGSPEGAFRASEPPPSVPMIVRHRPPLELL